MKNKHNIFLVLCLFMFHLCLNIKNVYADEQQQKLDIDLSQLNLYDTFEYNDYNYTISQLNSSDIYVNDEQIDIYNFEVEVNNGDTQTWRKYVKFDDLCSDEHICKDFSEEGTIVLSRTYSQTINNKVMYYTT